MSYQNYFKERIVDNNPTIEKLAELSTLFKRNSTIQSEFGLRNFAQFTNKEEISQQKLKLSQTHNSDSFKVNHRDSNGNPIQAVVDVKNQFLRARKSLESTWLDYQESKFKGEDIYTKLLERKLLQDFEQFKQVKSQVVRTESQYRENHVKFSEFQKLEESFKEKNPFTTSNVTFEMNDPAYYEKYLSRDKQDNLRKEREIERIQSLSPEKKEQTLNKIKSYSQSVFEVSNKLNEAKRTLFKDMRTTHSDDFKIPPKVNNQVNLSKQVAINPAAAKTIQINKQIHQSKVNEIERKQSQSSKFQQLKLLVATKFFQAFQSKDKPTTHNHSQFKQKLQS